LALTLLILLVRARARRNGLHEEDAPLFRTGFARGSVLVATTFSLGCLSNSYYVQRDELRRLATLSPDERWQSVRAVQRIGGDDNPTDENMEAPEPESETVYGTVYGTTVAIDSHLQRSCPPPRAAHPVRAPVAVASGGESGGGGGGHGASLTGSSNKGKADPADAVAIAAAVVVGTGTVIGLAASEGARYDGWLAVNREEPIHLQLANGGTRPVALSQLNESDLARAEGATIYEGGSERFYKLGRAPLDRAGFTMGAAGHFGGVPEIDRRMGVGAGGYLNIGGDIANVVTLGLSATVDSGINTQNSVLLVTVGPELDVFPTRYIGFYGAGGWAFRNTYLAPTRADEGWAARGGIVGEFPLSTRLALQARVGAAKYAFDENAPITWESQLGLAVY
jgi:hypothetical protein